MLYYNKERHNLVSEEDLQIILTKNFIKKTEEKDSYVPLIWQFPITGEYKYIKKWGEKKGNKYHLGIDIRPVSKSREVYAASDGIIIERGYDPDNGNIVIIQHCIRKKNLYSVYGQLEGSVVIPGQNIKKGEKIGVIGKTGKLAEECCLHFTITTQYRRSIYHYGDKIMEEPHKLTRCARSTIKWK